MTEKDFRSSLLSWYDENKREMPWRDCDNPYKTWISEVMLQQTRVDQAIPYFNRFIERFPDVYELAKAEQQEVLKVWEGLGYYSRARNLHQAAKTVVDKFDGNIPNNEKEILKLKGVGPYTASAVLSIAFSKSHAVVDGNVLRVLTRYLGIEDDIRSTRTKNTIQDAADELLDKNRPGDFNQAIMELGATICTPSNPDCKDCPINAGCVAYSTMKTDVIPYKSPAKKRPHHQIGVGIIQADDQVLIALRPEDAMLGGLWEFPGGKQKKGENIKKTVIRELKEELGVEVTVTKPFMKLDHAYSHFKITLHAFLCKLKNGNPRPKTSQEIKWVPTNELDQYPFPKANRKLTDKLMKPDHQKELDL
ncbi:MAG: A/G-specific adenine glycosylase [Candidatus Halalkalibacterium sp. M3_1C_030]